MVLNMELTTQYKRKQKQITSITIILKQKTTNIHP